MADQPQSQDIRQQSIQQSNPLQKFLNEEQNAKIVQKVLEKIRQILTNGEEILHVATQKKLINFSPDCAILTNKRFIVYRPTFLGAANFQDYIWRELHDAQLSEGILHAKIYFI